MTEQEKQIGILGIPGQGVFEPFQLIGEIAFDAPPRYQNPTTHGEQIASGTVARFRHINVHVPHTHHDALEFPGGQIVLVTRLCEGQMATVLQLPVDPAKATEQKTEEPTPQSQNV